jgi:hypothetical protein
MNWPFIDPPNTAVITTKGIAFRNEPILSVWHDAADGSWDFLGSGGAPEDESEMCLIALFEVVDHDASLAALADLPLGWCAWRKSVDEAWRRAPIPVDQQRAGRPPGK